MQLLDNPRFSKNNLLLILGLLVVAGILSLVFAQQLVTGWIALGERINISRRDFNLLELGSMVGMTLWGLIVLWAAGSAFANSSAIRVQDYFHQGKRTPAALLAMIFLAASVIVSWVVTYQLAMGWWTLGERANISRRDFNTLEILAMTASLLWGLLNATTLWGFLQRRQKAWAWAQWLLLLTVFIAPGILLDGFVRASDANVGAISDQWQRFGEAGRYIFPGLIATLSSIGIYWLLTRELTTSADQTIRNRLARTPGAGAIVGFIVIFASFSIATELFIEPRAQAGSLSTNITNGVVAIGITMLMISGEFDLSVGSIYGASALIFLLAMTEGVLGSGPLPVLPAAIIGLSFATFLGWINGILLIRTGIPSFIVTLGTLLAYRAIPLVLIADGRILRFADYPIAEPVIWFNRWVIIIGSALLAGLLGFIAFRMGRNWLADLTYRLKHYNQDMDYFREFFIIVSALRLVMGLGLILLVLYVLASMGIVNQLDKTDSLMGVPFFDLANGRFESLPIFGQLDRDVNLRAGVIWWLVLVFFFQFVLTQTPYGNFVFAVGGNPGAARAQGINSDRVKVYNFMLSGFLCGVAGIMNVARVKSVNANLGEGLELEVIAASVIGGTLLTGGYGSIFGALLGVLIFGMLQTGLVLVGMDPRYFFGVIGVIIIVAVVINTAVRQQRK
jgi:ribose/xylose/arabinose/galactoside ABC-type transport system permease subunit